MCLAVLIVSIAAVLDMVVPFLMRGAVPFSDMRTFYVYQMPEAMDLFA